MGRILSFCPKYYTKELEKYFTPGSKMYAIFIYSLSISIIINTIKMCLQQGVGHEGIKQKTSAPACSVRQF